MLNRWAVAVVVQEDSTLDKAADIMREWKQSLPAQDFLE